MAKNESQFTNFKIHSQFSICEGAVKIDELAQYCKKNKVKAIGLCDSNNLCGALEIAEKISKVGTQPLIGSQINFKKDNFIGKLPVFAKSEKGYRNLTKLSSSSYLEIDGMTEPYCSLDQLIKNKEGLILMSGSVYDFFGKLFQSNKVELINQIFKSLSNNFKNDFYIEIQRHEETGEKDFENFLLNSSIKFNLPLIASQEVFYIKEEMAEAHDALICVGEKRFVDETNRRKYKNNHFLRDSIEIENLFSDLPEALENNYNFSKRFNFKPKKTKPILPKINLKKNSTVDSELLLHANNGLKNRLENFILIKNKNKEETVIKKIYQDRLDHELNIIN